MNRQQEDPGPRADSGEEVARTEAAAKQGSTDETELSDQELENVAGGAKGVAIGKGIRTRGAYWEEGEAE